MIKPHLYFHKGTWIVNIKPLDLKKLVSMVGYYEKFYTLEEAILYLRFLKERIFGEQFLEFKNRIENVEYWDLVERKKEGAHERSRHYFN